MAEWFNRYLCDPAATIDVDGIFYYRIIAKQEMTIGENSVLLCNVDYRIGGQTGDYFKDENGKRFCIRGIEHIRFNGGIPEWYFKAPVWVLETDSNEIGEYLTFEKTISEEK